jgi:hypothetical protein
MIIVYGKEAGLSRWAMERLQSQTYVVVVLWDDVYSELQLADDSRDENTQLQVGKLEHEQYQ